MNNDATLLMEIDMMVARLEEHFTSDEILDGLEEYLALADEFQPSR
jgi:hypothetical protein